MFSKKLEDLIQAALKDGVLTEQEKEAIMKRALAEGEDKDEVEIYIQSLMQEKSESLGEYSGKIRSMISRISEASNRMKVKEGKIFLEREVKILNRELFNELKSEGKSEFLHSDPKGNFLTYQKEYDYYFPLMNELECMYGDIPKVRKFITEQKKKELETLSKAFLEETDSYKKASSSKDKVEKILNAEKCLLTIKKSYGSLPESQSLISEYQNKIDKIKSSLRYKFAYITKWMSK